MTTDIYNFEVSQGNFDDVVLKNSYTLPVFALFMSSSISSSIQLEHSLSAFAKEFAGQFILARIDVDMETTLRDDYNITNVPTVKVFKSGEVVHQEMGLLQDHELTELFKTHGIYRASDEARLKAREKHVSGNTDEAIQILTAAIQSDPGNTRIAMDMIQIMLDIGLLNQAKDLFNKLPDKDKESETGRALVGQITFKDLAAKTAGKMDLLAQVGDHPDNFDARFDLAVCYVAEHEFEEAMKQLFTILEQDASYKEGAAQELVVNVINMLEPNNAELAQDFRRTLSNLLTA